MSYVCKCGSDSNFILYPLPYAVAVDCSVVAINTIASIFGKKVFTHKWSISPLFVGAFLAHSFFHHIKHLQESLNAYDKILGEKYKEYCEVRETYENELASLSSRHAKLLAIPETEFKAKYIREGQSWGVKFEEEAYLRHRHNFTQNLTNERLQLTKNFNDKIQVLSNNMHELKEKILNKIKPCSLRNYCITRRIEWIYFVTNYENVSKYIDAQW